MKLDDAEEIAYEITEAIAPFCERVQVAGSIRRRKAEVGDIEVCAIPTWEKRRDYFELFGAGDGIKSINLLWEHRNAVGCQWIKPATGKIVPWYVRPEGKYWRGLIDGRIKLDLFLCDMENWGWIFAIRTGSAAFSTALLTHAKRLGYHSAGGRLCRDSQPIATPEEEDVFRFLNLQFVVPELRQDEGALRSRRAS